MIWLVGVLCFLLGAIITLVVVANTSDLILSKLSVLRHGDVDVVISVPKKYRVLDLSQLAGFLRGYTALYYDMFGGEAEKMILGGRAYRGDNRNFMGHFPETREQFFLKKMEKQQKLLRKANKKLDDLKKDKL